MEAVSTTTQATQEAPKRASLDSPAFYKLAQIDDPKEWMRASAYDPPTNIDIAKCQEEIDAIYGTTRGGSIMKLVWNGDRRFWHELYMSWDANGKPDKPVVRRPRLRYKTLRDRHGAIIRDVFPPRWLILTRLEPEQFPNYVTESWVRDPARKVYKQIRPDTPPPVYWLWYSTISHHNDHCCTVADKNKEKCFGTYAPPQHIYEQLGNQKRSDLAQGLHRNPFEQIDPSMLREVEAVNNGYEHEITQLQMAAEIHIENPWALIGPKAAMRLGIDTTKKARALVKDYFDKELQDANRDKGRKTGEMN